MTSKDIQLLKIWQPFRIIPAKELEPSLAPDLYYVVAEAPNFDSYVAFEGYLNQCELACSALNNRVSTSLAYHVQKSLTERLP